MYNPFDKYNKNIHETLRLSHEEKSYIRAALEQKMLASPFAPRVSPYRHFLRPLQMVALTLVVVLAGGGTLARFADAALPGDPLYGFKINVNEEIRSLVKTTPEAKFKYQVRRIETLSHDAAISAATGTLDEESREVIKKNLTKQTEKAQDIATRLEIINPDAALQLESKLALSLETHSKFLEEVQALADESDLSEIVAHTQEVARSVTAKVAASEEAALGDDGEEAEDKQERRAYQRLTQVRDDFNELEGIVEQVIPTLIETPETILLPIEEPSVVVPENEGDEEREQPLEEEEIDITSEAKAEKELAQEEAPSKELAETEIAPQDQEGIIEEEVQEAPIKETPKDVVLPIPSEEESAMVAFVTDLMIRVQDIRETITSSEQLLMEGSYSEALTLLQGASKDIEGLRLEIRLELDLEPEIRSLIKAREEQVPKEIIEASTNDGEVQGVQSEDLDDKPTKGSDLELTETPEEAEEATESVIDIIDEPIIEDLLPPQE